MTAQDEPQEETGRSSPHTSGTEHCRKVLHCPLHIICVKESRKSSHSPSPPRQLSLKAPFPPLLAHPPWKSVQSYTESKCLAQSSGRAQPWHCPPNETPLAMGIPASPILKFDSGTGLGEGRQEAESCFKGNSLLNTQPNVLMKAEICQASPLQGGTGPWDYTVASTQYFFLQKGEVWEGRDCQTSAAESSHRQDTLD